MVRDGEIVGLKDSSNGRACVQHACCDVSLQVDDLLHFKISVVIQEDGMAETLVKAVLIWDGTETCTIGFLPRQIAVVQRKRDLIAE